MKRALAFLVAASAGCLISAETSEEGKPCPCSEAYECDQTKGTCRTPVSCSPRFSVEGFHAKWTTPETIRWDWMPIGQAADHFGYRLIIGRSPDEVASGSGNVTVFDARINPELGGYDIPDQNGFNLVSFTISDGLTPATDFYGRLEVKDSLGCTFSSEVVKATTQPAPTQSISIFDEQLRGYASPCALAPSPGCGVDGSACLRCSADESELGRCLWDVDNPYTTDVENGWESLHFVEHFDFSAVDREALASGRAFLELYVGLRSPTPVYYTEIDFITRGDDCIDGLGVCDYYIDLCLTQGDWHTMRGLFIRPRSDGFDKLQVPLVQFLSDETGPLTHERLASPLQSGLRLAASFLDATELDIDRITVRW